jgi:ABC-2 type transport system permease protein
MVAKEFRQLGRDRRTVALMVFLPLLLIVIFGYAANFNVTRISVEVVGPGARLAAQELPATFEVVRVDPSAGRAEAVTALRDGVAATALVTTPTGVTMLIDGSQLFVAQTALRVAARVPASMHLTTKVLFNPTLRTSDVMVPGLAGMILLFIGTVITSLGVVRERQSGTLEQLAVMPIRPTDVILGKIAPYFVVGLLDMAIVVVVSLWLFNVPFVGSVGTFALGGLLFLFVALGMGVLISSVSQNQGQAIQLAIMVLLPQFMLSGLIFPLASMPAGVRWIGYVLPLTYFDQVAKDVMLRGAPLHAEWRPLVFLAGLGVLVMALAILRFRSMLGAHRRGSR